MYIRDEKIDENSRDALMNCRFIFFVVLLFARAAGRAGAVSSNTNTSSTNSHRPHPITIAADRLRKRSPVHPQRQYTYIWVFSRKDGKPLDTETTAFPRTNAPQVVDWVTTDEGKKGNRRNELQSRGRKSGDLLKKRFVRKTIQAINGAAADFTELKRFSQTALDSQLTHAPARLAERQHAIDNRTNLSLRTNFIASSNSAFEPINDPSSVR
jgi:hypothetical protein